MSERRRFSRVVFAHDLILRTSKGVTYSGSFNDVSLKGMLFWCEGQLPEEDDEVEGIMPLGEDQIVLRGRVVRSFPTKGAAIRFVDMDLESFSHLRRLVSLNMGDAELIDQEFFDSI